MRAHVALDKAVDGCYRPAAFPTELSRLKFRFTAYRQQQAPFYQVGLVQASSEGAAKVRTCRSLGSP